MVEVHLRGPLHGQQPTDGQKRYERFLNERNCEECEKGFQPSADTSKFCSVACLTSSLRRCERPTKEILEALVWEFPSTELAERFKVSDTAIAKWCKAYGISKPPRGYWAKHPRSSVEEHLGPNEERVGS